MSNILERFKAKYMPEPNSGCWLWIAATQPPPSLPYGRFRVGGRKGRDLYAHRLSYEIFMGKIPSGLFVLHKCDTPQCVNPSHLFLGTKQDNSDDKMRKGRDRKVNGSSHHNSILHESDIPRIRQMVSQGYSSREIGLEFGVNKATIKDIRAGRCWRHIPLT